MPDDELIHANPYPNFLKIRVSSPTETAHTEVRRIHKAKSLLMNIMPTPESSSIAAALVLCAGLNYGGDAVAQPAEIKVVDEASGRGVPLVELTTVNHLQFITDNAGRIAFDEPGLMGRTVFFHVKSHGYEFFKDGFGYRGKAVTPVAGKKITLKVNRLNLAERLYRITGQGLYRDSTMLGYETPLKYPLSAGLVSGQDSSFAVPYDEKVFWFWGDTSRMAYPLGHFGMGGATSEFSGHGGLDPSVGVDLNYFVDDKGFSRPMCRLDFASGLIWADGFTTVKDGEGKERLVCHFVHLKTLGEILGHGIAIYDDDREEFVRLATLEMDEIWRWPTQAHPIHLESEGKEYLLFGDVYPTVRVPATLEDYENLDSYEAWTCLKLGSTKDVPIVDRSSDGTLHWSWTKDGLPVDSRMEQVLVDTGLIKAEEARGQLLDADSGKTVKLHRGSVNWNAHRQHWVMIFGELGGSTSNIGEIWYAEAESPTGPWNKATKIVTHDQYSFYNPVYHAFLDQENGRFIYFEGTYVTTFSGNPEATPRYDYNQIMYRLDLDDPRLTPARVE